MPWPKDDEPDDEPDGEPDEWPDDPEEDDDDGEDPVEDHAALESPVRWVPKWYVDFRAVSSTSVHSSDFWTISIEQREISSSRDISLLRRHYLD